MVGPMRNKRANFPSIADLARSDSSPYSRVPELHPRPTVCTDLPELQLPLNTSQIGGSNIPLLKVRFYSSYLLVLNKSKF